MQNVVKAKDLAGRSVANLESRLTAEQLKKNDELVEKMTQEDLVREKERSKESATGVWKRKFFDESE